MKDGFGDTRALVEAGKLAALTVVLSLLVAYFPLFSFITLAICPIPILVISVRHGLKHGFLTAITAGILTAVLVGVLEAIPIFLLVLLLGVGQGLAIKSGLRATRTLAIGVVAVILSLVILAFLVYFSTGVNIVAEQARAFEEALAIQKEIYLRAGLSQKEVESQLEAVRNMAKVLPFILPAGAVVFSCWVSLLNFLVSSQALKRVGFQVPSLPRFREWQLPWYFAWGYILGLAAVLFRSFFGEHSRLAFLVGMNLLIVFISLFLIQGISITTFFFDKYRLSRGVKIALSALAFLAQLLFYGLSWLGLLDTWFDYRKLAIGANGAQKGFDSTGGKEQ